MATAALLLAAATATATPISSGAYRVELVKEGQSVSVHLQDVNKAAITIDVEAPSRDLSEDGEHWTTHIHQPLTSKDAPHSFYLPDAAVWPRDVTVIATVRPSVGTAATSTTTFALRPVPWVGFLFAIAGAVLWSFIDQARPRPKGARTRGGALVSGCLAGSAAYLLANIEPVWKLLGVTSQNFQLQTYGLIGLFVAYAGVPYVLNKAFGRIDEADKSDEPLTGAALKTRYEEMLKGIDERYANLIRGDAVRQPLREELQAALFDENYLQAYPEIVPRVEAAVAEAKYGAVPEDLIKFLRSRLQQVHTQSHREGLKIHLGLKTEDDWFEWTQTMSYSFVRNVNDRSTDPEIRFSSRQTIPPALIGAPGLMSLGTMVLSIDLSISNDEAGELQFRGVQGQELVIRKTGRTAMSLPPIPVDFKPANDTPGEPEMIFGYDFAFPEEFRKQERVAVEVVARWRAKIDDGIMSVRFARLTNGYFMTYQFAPLPPPDVLVFEWRTLWEQYRNDEVKPGIIDLPRWLLPGNGVCLGWHGTQAALKTKANEHRTVL